MKEDLRKHREKLKRSAEELEQSNEDIKSFASIISHDLRAPLTNIKGFAGEIGYSLKELESVVNTLKMHLDADRRKKLETILHIDIPEEIGFINSSVARMDNLLSALVNLLRLGYRELNRGIIHMPALIESVLHSLTPQIDRSHAKITVGELPDIYADRIAMEQIIGNILDNALKYLEPERAGQIEISAERSADKTIFHIRDNGRGIAKEDMQNVFEIFRRVGQQNVHGEGMGLACVKALVRRHGGNIWCESEPGAGTTFSFSIPDRSAVPENAKCMADKNRDQ